MKKQAKSPHTRKPTREERVSYTSETLDKSGASEPHTAAATAAPLPKARQARTPGSDSASASASADSRLGAQPGRPRQQPPRSSSSHTHQVRSGTAAGSAIGGMFRRALPQFMPHTPEPASRDRPQTNAERNVGYADLIFAKPLRHKTHRGSASFFWRVAPTLAFGILLFLGLEHFDVVTNAFQYIMRAFNPVLIAMGLAFVLSIPMDIFERRLFVWIRSQSLRRGLSVLLCYLLLGASLITFVFVIIPQLLHALDALSSALPEIGRQLFGFAQKLVENYDLDPEILSYLSFDWNGMAKQMIEWVATSFPQVVNTTRDITAGMFEIFMGVVISVYMLFGKDKLAQQAQRLTYAVCARDWADRITAFGRLMMNTFHGFITGQLTESAILGTLCGCGMALFGFTQPVLTGVLIGIGGLIPIFGIPIMITVSSLLLAVQAGINQALWFILYILVLQQFEGNLIYPRVMGNAISLPGLWVLSAAVISNSLFGITGLFVSIPAASVLYTLVRSFINTRLARLAAEAEDELDPNPPPD